MFWLGVGGLNQKWLMDVTARTRMFPSQDSEGRPGAQKRVASAVSFPRIRFPFLFLFFAFLGFPGLLCFPLTGKKYRYIDILIAGVLIPAKYPWSGMHIGDFEGGYPVHGISKKQNNVAPLF